MISLLVGCALATAHAEPPAQAAAQNPDVQRLLHFVLPLAQSSVEKYGGFYPFGASVGTAGELAALPAFSGRDTPDPKDVHELTVKALRRMVAEGKIRAAAIATDNTVARPDSPETSNEIQVRIETRTGEAMMIHVAYEKSVLGGIKLKPDTVKPEASILFSPEPPAAAPAAKKKPRRKKK